MLLLSSSCHGFGPNLRLCLVLTLFRRLLRVLPVTPLVHSPVAPPVPLTHTPYHARLAITHYHQLFPITHLTPCTICTCLHSAISYFPLYTPPFPTPPSPDSLTPSREFSPYQRIHISRSVALTRVCLLSRRHCFE